MNGKLSKFPFKYIVYKFPDPAYRPFDMWNAHMLIVFFIQL